MQVRRKPIQDPGTQLFAFPGYGSPPGVVESIQEARGLGASVRFFVDYVISVAVNSVARKQALRTKLHISGSGGLTLNLVITTLDDTRGQKFVAYSNDMSLFTESLGGLLVMNDTPRELEHSIYLYLSERFSGQQRIRVELERETSSPFALPVLEGSSDNGPRSLTVKAESA